VTTEKTTEIAVPTTKEELRGLLKRAQKGDTATLPTIRKLLENPAYIDMFGGNLAKYVEESFVKALSDKDLSIQEAIYTKLKSLRKELLGPDPNRAALGRAGLRVLVAGAGRRDSLCHEPEGDDLSPGRVPPEANGCYPPALSFRHQGVGTGSEVGVAGAPN
jgi:hypothetical protein